ncbi:hypothetical protein GCM10017083_51960 [Thalassobaculum fulvum]|uniref:Ankyrin repeat n=1 Tax=Thalassobaculum fulvum TaxID=1633335 RepID=A0A918XXH3_9PROT|nr:ankyrin repeat domain-containing protein [Thalassobaculum fulvum]GHD62746.1 hypothetical protein GCM10017083_51960 [Thalassobaculum fulvum]
MSEAGPARGMEAQQRVNAFFKACGGPSLLLCAHAAVLERLRPEPLALIRRNFLPPVYAARADLDADVLYGPLADPQGNDYFAIDKEVRRILLTALDAYGGRNGNAGFLTSQVARFLRYYARWARDRDQVRLVSDPRFEGYLDELDWVALGFDEPDKAAAIVDGLLDGLDADGPASSVRIDVGTPAALLSLPMKSRSSRLAGLQALEYARRGEIAQARRLIEPFASLPASLRGDGGRTFSSLLGGYESGADADRADRRDARASTVSEHAPPPSMAAGRAEPSTIPDDAEDSDLHVAVRSGDADRLLICLETRTFDLDAPGADGKSPLRIAAELGLLQQIGDLIEAGADIDLADATGVPPLIAAIDENQEPAFALLLEHGADPNARRSNGTTALMAAVSGIRTGMTGVLLDREVELSPTNERGHGVLEIAAAVGDLPLFTTLTERGCRIEPRSLPGFSLMQCAAYGGHPDIIGAVVAAGADPNGDEHADWPTVAIAAFRNRAHGVDALIDLGADPDRATSDGWTPLMIAASLNLADVVSGLLRHGADPNVAKSPDGYTALLVACYPERADGLRALLTSRWLDRRQVGRDRRSALLIAVQSGDPAVVRALLEDDAIERNARTDHLPPIWKAIELDKPEILALLYADPLVSTRLRRDGDTVMDWAVKTHNVPAIRALLARRPRLDDVDQAGDTLIMKAVARFDPKVADDCERILRLLLEAGAPVEAPLEHPERVPIWEAIRRDNQAFVRLLIEYGADVHVPGPSRQTLLHVAPADLVDLLVERGLSPKAPDADGLTPLMSAARVGASDRVQALLRHTDPNTVTTAGWSALHFAARHGDADLIDLLTKAGAAVDLSSEVPPRTPLQAAAEVGAREACVRLVENRADIDRHTALSATPLLLAIGNGQFTTAVELIRRGASLAIVDPRTGASALDVFERRAGFEAEAGIGDAQTTALLATLLSSERAPSTLPVPPPPAALAGRETEVLPAGDGATEGEVPQRGPASGVPSEPGPTAADPQALANGVLVAGLDAAPESAGLPAPWTAVSGAEHSRFLAQIRPVDGKHQVPDEHTQVASTTLPFYRDVRLIRVRDRLWEHRHLAIFYLSHGPSLYRLNGTSPPIHEVNAKAGLSITEANALAYLRFFCFFVRGEEGPFYILESTADPCLNPALSPRAVEVVRNTIRPASLEGRNGRGHFLADAVIAYSNALFIGNFGIQPTGMIDMIDDEPIAADLNARVVDVPVS